jgi:catechol 2,3-dioxygenase-like lactoylglutathione lyase family enzyme
MSQSVAHLTLLVRNYDEALEFYTQKLGFHPLQDTPLHDKKRCPLSHRLLDPSFG